ncbi:hypothetical protein [Devosia sp.]|uniref:hypothetical protein n=1 Tax=Devosia sp. TaxID=1871048 RepID=UPI002F0E2445
MAFSEKLVQEAWERARASADQDPSVWRLDECGAWMRREHYGRENSEFGWKVEITSAGGPETIENLRAFNMGNAFDRAQGSAKCCVLADRVDQHPWEHASAPRNRDVGPHHP